MVMIVAYTVVQGAFGVFAGFTGSYELVPPHPPVFPIRPRNSTGGDRIKISLCLKMPNLDPWGAGCSDGAAPHDQGEQIRFGKFEQLNL